MIKLEKYINEDKRSVYRYCVADLTIALRSTAVTECHKLDRNLSNLYKSVQFVSEKDEFYFTNPDEEVVFLMSNKYEMIIYDDTMQSVGQDYFDA